MQEHKRILYSNGKIRVPYRKAYLMDNHGNVHSYWRIIYYIWDGNKQALVRQQKYGGINKHRTLSKRYEVANELIDEINELLEEGYHLKRTIGKNEIDPDQVQRMKILVAMDHYIADKKGEVEETTIKTYKSGLKHFREFMADQGVIDGVIYKKLPLKKIDANLLRSYVAWCKERMTNRSVNNNMRIMAQFLNYFTAMDNWLFRVNPLKFFKKLPETTSKHAAYSKDQIREIRDECLKRDDAQLWLFLQFMYYTLARPYQEVRYIRCGHIKGERLWIPATASKNKKGDFVTIPKVFRSELEKLNLGQYPEDYYLFSADQKPSIQVPGKNYFYKRFTKVIQALDMNGSESHYDIYAFKHSGAINMYLSKVPIDRIQQQCRHQSIQQTMEYLRDLDVFRDSSDYDQVEGL